MSGVLNCTVRSGAVVLKLAKNHSASRYVRACYHQAHDTSLLGEESLLLSLSHKEEYKDKAANNLLDDSTENIVTMSVFMWSVAVLHFVMAEFSHYTLVARANGR